jgi:dihydroorotate dehydrogenase
MTTTRSIASNFSSPNVSKMQLNALQEPPEIMKQTTKNLYDNAAEVA